MNQHQQLLSTNITLRDVNDAIRNHPVELIGQRVTWLYDRYETYRCCRLIIKSLKFKASFYSISWLFIIQRNSYENNKIFNRTFKVSLVAMALGLVNSAWAIDYKLYEGTVYKNPERTDSEVKI